MSERNSGGGGWLDGSKKLWTTLTTEVQNIFTEPKATTKADESRVGQMAGRGSYMNEFEQQLNRELADPSRSSSPPTAAFPSAHYGQPITSPGYHQEAANSAWNPHAASDMGLNPSLPAYQQQRLQHMPSAHALGEQQQPAASTSAAPFSYPQPGQPYPSAASSPAAAAPNGHPYFASSPAAPAPYTGAGYSAASPYPPSPYPNHGSAAPSSSLQQPPASLPYPTPSSFPNTPSSPYQSAPTHPSPGTPGYPSPANPAYAPAPAAYASSSPYQGGAPSSYPPPTSSSPYAPGPTSAASSSPGYVGPSFTSAAYSSSSAAALPPPPPSNYWVNRAAQQSAVPASKLGLGLDHVDYSDLNPASMDFAYAQRYNKPSGQS